MTEDSPKIAVIPPLALLIAIAVAFALEWALPLKFLPPYPWTLGLIVGIPLIAASIFVNFSGARAFLSAGTPINPYKSSTTIVRSGVYRFTRNPMYLGMIGFLAATGLIFSVDWALIATPVLWAVFHWGVVLREETYLSQKFGAEYDAFLAQTRRWI